MDSITTAPVPQATTNSKVLNSKANINYKLNNSIKHNQKTTSSSARLYSPAISKDEVERINVAGDEQLKRTIPYINPMISNSTRSQSHLCEKRLLTLFDENYDDSADVVLHKLTEKSCCDSGSSLSKKFENLQLHTKSSSSELNSDTVASSDRKEIEGIIGQSQLPFLTLTNHAINTNSTPQIIPSNTKPTKKCLSQSSSTATITSSSSPTTSSINIESPSPLSPTAPKIPSEIKHPNPNATPRQLVSKAQSLDLASDEDDHQHSPYHMSRNPPSHPSNPHCIVDIVTPTEEDSQQKSKSPRDGLLLRAGHQSQPELETSQKTNNVVKLGTLPKMQSTDSRPIYPNVPYSPYGSPYGSPRSNRRRQPLRESRRISIEKSGSFLQLNQYKLMDQIGQGSYGLVKLAYSEEDSTHYAMKILSKRRLLRKAGLMGRGPKKTTSPLDRVYREIAVLKKLDHPNVVKLVEVLDDPLEDSLYLVFELVQLGEVLSVPADKPLTEERTWSVFRDAVQGLEYLHYQRIIHADIKPGNLLLDECGRVKIADLGVCNEFLGEDATMNNGSSVGTPAFRAPETLIPGQHVYSGKAVDIWALGATLYTLVVGNVPFVASSVPAVYDKIKNDPLTFPDNLTISPDLRDLIERMLNKNPSERITLPQIKEHPWVTANGAHPLPSEEENCRLVQVSEEDINSVVTSIPKLDTLILIKTMLKNHSFLNPFTKGVSGRAPQRGGSRLERFIRSGRSNSAPGAYHLTPDRQLSSDCILPALSEAVPSSNNDSSDDLL